MHLVKKIGVGHVDSSSKFKQTFYGKIRETQRGFNNFNLTREIVEIIYLVGKTCENKTVSEQNPKANICVCKCIILLTQFYHSCIL